MELLLGEERRMLEAGNRGYGLRTTKMNVG